MSIEPLENNAPSIGIGWRVAPPVKLGQSLRQIMRDSRGPFFHGSFTSEAYQGPMEQNRNKVYRRHQMMLVEVQVFDYKPVKIWWPKELLEETPGAPWTQHEAIRAPNDRSTPVDQDTCGSRAPRPA